MNNPFQVRSRFAQTNIKTSAGRKHRKFGLVSTAILAVLAGLLGTFWYAGQAGWIPGPLSSMLVLPGINDRIYIGGRPDHEQSRSLYRKALSQLEDGSYEAVLENFKKLEAVYPGLKDFLWLHQAEAYAGQGNEWAVQKKLGSLVEQMPDSPLRAIALYRIGQSQFRGSEWDKALATFKKVQADFPHSNYAMGSLYYQGALLAREPETRLQAAAPLRRYLTECLDCKFSGQAADLLEKLLPNPTPDEHALIGNAQVAASGDTKRALIHLQKGPMPKTWLSLGKARIRAGQPAEGVASLMQGLPHTQPGNDKDTAEVAREAVDLIIAHSMGSERVARLSQLREKRLPYGGDYVLWRLAEFNPGSAAIYYDAILREYPEGDYAPESGWNRLWPLLGNGQNSAFMEQARQYVAEYPYARSAPKALFWMAKLSEKDTPVEATRLYQRITRQYPANYYAFRAQGRLKPLTENQPDPGWATGAGRSHYPPADTGPGSLDILPPMEALGGGRLGYARRLAGRELQAIGAADDVKLLVEGTTGKLTPAVESWAEQTAGDRSKGMRIIRDALEERSREAFKAASANELENVRPTVSQDEYKLLYPVYFADSIAPIARRNNLDPYLVQALMREESYFNEFAISTSNARGLMQLLPPTAAEVAGWEDVSGFQTAHLFLPETNVRLGSRYLAHLHELFNGNSMPSVGAYNGGPNAMKRWVQNSAHFQSDPDMFVERIPYEQSRDYIKKVFGSYWNYLRLYGKR